MNNGSDAMMDKARDVQKDISDLNSMAVDSVKEKAAQMKEDAANLYERGRSGAADMYEKGVAGATNMYEKGCAQAGDLQKQTENYIKQEPLKAVLIAAAAGLAIGFILSSRRSN